MELSDIREVEGMRRDILMLEEEEKELKERLETVTAKKNSLLAELSKKTDEKYEQDVLAMLYEQRRNGK